jgi:thymidylate synthase
MRPADSFHAAYRNLLTELHHHGVEELNQRTKVKIKMLQGGHSFKLDLSDCKVPVAGNRRYWPHIAAAEVAWQFMGTRNPEFILRQAPKLWSKFVEDGELKTAYGYRWREAFGRDQLDLAMKALTDDPSNRQVWMQAWDPRTDGLGQPGQPKNIPCPIGFTLGRDKNKVHMSLFIRSSDVFVGLPYDVMCYALTLDAICASMGLVPGTLHVTLAHPHIYEPHWKMVQACVTGEFDSNDWDGKKRFGDRSSWSSDVEPAMPGMTIEHILSAPDGYVEHVKRLSARVGYNPWNPMPEVIE